MVNYISYYGYTQRDVRMPSIEAYNNKQVIALILA